jgi:hypothetical protein
VSDRVAAKEKNFHWSRLLTEPELIIEYLEK